MTSSGEAKHVRQQVGEHTPGPWEWWTSCSWKRLTSKTADGKWMREGNVLCPSIASDGHPVLDVSEADMALIAAAPEMLGALPDLSAVITWLENGCDPVKAAGELRIYQGRIQSAIAKATGGAS